MSKRLMELVENLPAAKVVLLGDLMLDRYLYGSAERLSPEAPVPVLHFQRQEERLGGAANVVADLSVLGAKVRVVSIVGGDQDAGQILKMLANCGADTSGVVQSPQRPSTAKVRFVGLAQDRHAQQLLRVDYEEPGAISDAEMADVLARLEKALDGADALCIEDYNKGLLRPDLCQAAIAMARRRQVPVLVDPANISDYSKYAHATVITPNRHEAKLATGLPATQPEVFGAAAQRLLETLDLEAVILTLDKEGAYLATRDGQRRWLKTRQRTVYEVTGAGDMVLAMLTMGRCAGASWAEAVSLANVAGGLEVERFGAVPITRKEIIQELLSEMHEHLGKQRALEELLGELQYHRSLGKRIVFTNGCFDLIHMGHVKYFQFAKAQGDLLVVAVNTDEGIRRLKGPKRPIINERDRISVLEELESIDYLILFEQDTPLDLIQQIKPDVLVKGADYAKEEVVGSEFVEGQGGKVALAPLVDGRSTSAVIDRILEAYK